MIKLITIPIIERKVLLVTYPSDALKAARKHKMGRNLIQMIKSDPPDCQACCYQDEQRPRYVLYFKNKELGVVVHECDHVIFHMFKLIGAASEQEFRAYTKEWLFNEVRKSMRVKKL